MSNPTLTNMQPESVLRYFQELSSIPRESGNEEGVRNYIKQFAQNYELFCLEDETGNIIIRKPASPGYEGAPSIAIQGHMDMVCVKEEGYEHDFATDPIKLKVEDDYLTAEGTSLGADNGIAIAMILALFSDPEAVHGPLEGVFTVSEETGLGGAFGLDINNLHSRKLLNLDSEEEGYFYIGCAGGGEVQATLQAMTQTVPAEDRTWTVTASGFLGGHSGAEIHTGRGNAIKSVMRYLKLISRLHPIRIVTLSGGTKRNVIPSQCTCTFTVDSSADAAVLNIAEEINTALGAELGDADPNAHLKVTNTQNASLAVASNQSRAVIDSLYVTPNGVEAMSKTIEGLVETSNNLAIVSLRDNMFSFTVSQRSSIMSARDEIEERTCTALELCGAETVRENKYPAWTPNPDSELAKLCAASYRAFTGKDPVISAIHGGLECGVINSKAPDMDSISFGPNLHDVHSPDEKLSISSAARVYDFLQVLLKDLAKKA
ncbi:MAG: aminoacyl-histidine dipeptidase [Spirochaetota bacterium]